MTQREATGEYPWPHGLLTIAEYGCGIYFAVDLLDPQLRVVDYEVLGKLKNPKRYAKKHGCQLAYTDGEVPVDVQHWFVVTSPALYAWLERWLEHGGNATRWTWLAEQRD